MKHTLNIKHCAAVIASMLLLCGCNMDLVPEGQMSTESFFSSATELQQYTNYFYRQLPNPETMYAEEGEHFVAPVPSDLVKGIRDVYSGQSDWSKSNWQNLRKINFYLQHSNKCSDPAARQQYDGVAYFFRAYFYFNMLQKFGAVPLYTQAIVADDYTLLSQPRNSREEVIRFILADCDSASAKLSSSPTIFEVNKWTALALKSRAALFEASFRKYHEGDKFNGGSDVYNEKLPWNELMQIAADASLQLIQDGPYSLYMEGTEPYRDFFACIDGKGCELIWGRHYSVDLNIKHNAQGWSVARVTGFTKRFADLYPMTDGKPFTSVEGYDTKTYLEVFENRDKRMAQTIYGPGYIQKGAAKTSPVPLTQTLTGYKYIKYVMESNYNGWGASVNCMPIFRLAEVYLNYAEAKAELGTITQNDLDITINKLRARGGVAPLSVNVAADPYMTTASGYGFSNAIYLSNAKLAVLGEIRRERMIETPLEGLHLWDVIRWKEGQLFTLPRYGIYFPDLGKYDMTGDGKANIELVTEKKGATLGVTKLLVGTDVVLTETTKGNMWAYPGLDFAWDEDKDYLYPIPGQQRTLTSGKLSQNPGWVDGTGY